jgi:hypothetical protein
MIFASSINVNVNHAFGIVKRVEKTEKVTKYITSYGLKHLVEKLLAIETNNKVSYVTNEELTEAMVLAGFKAQKTWNGSPNFHFNVSKKSLNTVFNEVLN